MRKHRRIITTAACVLILAGLCALPLHHDEPHYKGRTLSEWLSLYPGITDPDHFPQAREAIRQIGTNGIPNLLGWMQYEPKPSKIKDRLRTLFPKIPFCAQIAPIKRWLYIDAAQVRAEAAATAFETLGSNACPAVPELTKLANLNTNSLSAIRAVRALAGIGPTALPALLSVITNHGAPARFYAITSLTSLGTNAVPALPTLMSCLAEPMMGNAAGAVLSDLKLEPQSVVPALSQMVHSTGALQRAWAIIILRHYGPHARPATPTLLAALKDPEWYVRAEATKTLEEIAPEVLTNTPPQ